MVVGVCSIVTHFVIEENYIALESVVSENGCYLVFVALIKLHVLQYANAFPFPSISPLSLDGCFDFRTQKLEFKDTTLKAKEKTKESLFLGL